MNMSHKDFDDDSDLVDQYICHSSSGRFLTQFSLLKKSHGKRPSKNEMRGISLEEYRKGFSNEKLFMAMFNELLVRGNLPKEYGVRKASRNQDEKFKIDYWIDIFVESGNKISIPVQIKSSRRGKYEFIKEFGDRVSHIYVIVIDDKITLIMLMRQIFGIVAMELKRLQQAQSQPTT